MQYIIVQYSTVQYSAVQSVRTLFTFMHLPVLNHKSITTFPTITIHLTPYYFLLSHNSGDMPRNRSSVIKSLTRHTGPAVEISLGAVIGDTKAVQSASESITHPLSVRFATAPCEDRDTSHITTNLLNAFKVEVEEKGIQSSATPLEVSYKKIRSLSAPASRPSIQGSTGNRKDPPCLRGLRGTKTPTPVIVMGPIEEAFDPGYATTPVNMRSTTLFASSSENSSLGTTSISTSNRCSANTSGTNSPYESDIINTGKYNNRAYVTSTSIGNALKNLSVNNQDNNNNTISENTRKLQNLIPKCLSVKNSTVSNPGQKSVNAPRYPDYTNSYSSDGMRNTPTVSRIEDPRSRIEDPRSRIEDPRSTPEAEKSFSHVFSPRKDLNIPPPPRSHVLVGGGGKK